MLLRIQNMHFRANYRPGSENGIADCLSRCPLPSAPPAQEEFDVACHVGLRSDGLHCTQRQRIAKETASDSTLIKVGKALRSGKWPKHADLHAYRAVRSELSSAETDNGFLILRGNRIVLPRVAYSRVVRIAHQRHPGVRATKHRPREVVWFPRIASTVEQ